ncbi:glycosyltransferase family 2 protein [Conexibacter sp. DBS9H8]|uniref:glycosyltransferase family 2 protein n=1 Tax=Conexibacter sp. DBS9H8 TaxID=2937801 RepID=UPI00200EB1F2|nr:glycosyltransferase family 2 protein [Conexibacter sp. DBS9H8]
MLFAVLTIIGLAALLATAILRALPGPSAAARRPAPGPSAERRGTTVTAAADAVRPSVSVVVPALNEEESVGWVMENLPGWVDEVVLVDGLSVDGTELVVADVRPDVVVVHQRARGKGAALRAGFAAASGDVVVMLDADGSTDPREVGVFVDALVGGAQFVKGSRYLPGGGSSDFTWLRDVGNRGFVWLANRLFGVAFTDLCYGFCAFWRRDVGRLGLVADGFEIEMELVCSALRAGLSVVEVPSWELCRRSGVSNLHAWRDGWRVLGTLLHQRLHATRRTPADAEPVRLVPIKVPAPGTPQWVPAGSERRDVLAARTGHGRTRLAGRPGRDRREAPAGLWNVFVVDHAPATTATHAGAHLPESSLSVIGR